MIFRTLTDQVVPNDDDDLVFHIVDGGVENNSLQLPGRMRVCSSAYLLSFRNLWVTMLVASKSTMTLPMVNTTTTTILNTISCTTSHHIERTAKLVRTKMKIIQLSKINRVTQQGSKK